MGRARCVNMLSRSLIASRQSATRSVRGFSTPPSIAATGQLLLNDQKLAAAVGPDVWATFKDARESGAAVDKKTGNAIADALKDFAFAHGAVNYAHWFSPVRHNESEALNGIKHDSFIDLDFGSSEIIKPIVEDFSGTKLFFNETDGSSFPNGGLRDTHTQQLLTCRGTALRRHSSRSTLCTFHPPSSPGLAPLSTRRPLSCAHRMQFKMKASVSCATLVTTILKRSCHASAGNRSSSSLIAACGSNALI